MEGEIISGLDVKACELRRRHFKLNYRKFFLFNDLSQCWISLAKAGTPIATKGECQGNSRVKVIKEQSMKLDGVHSPILPVQSRPILQAQVLPEAPENEPEVTTEEADDKASGVISKLNEGDHFKGVADIRLRIAHYDNPDLVTIDLAPLENVDVPGKAYEKFLGQYEGLYLTSQTSVEPEGSELTTDSVVVEEPVNEVGGTGPVIVTPVEIEPVEAPEQTEVQEPVDEVGGIAALFEELWDIEALEENSETLDIVI